MAWTVHGVETGGPADERSQLRLTVLAHEDHDRGRNQS